MERSAPLQAKLKHGLLRVGVSYSCAKPVRSVVTSRTRLAAANPNMLAQTSRPNLRCGTLLALLFATGLTSCGGGGSEGAAQSTPPPPANSAPVISGAPLTAVDAGAAYAFTPTASDPDGNALSFSVQNKPDWAAFSIATGALTGTPSMAQAGTYSGITISVSDGKASAALAPFSIVVTSRGTATLNWTLPSLNTDGTALSDLAGVRIYYGSDPNALNQSTQQANPALTSYTVTNLAPGTWYFALTVYTTGGAESAQTGAVNATVL